MTHEPGAVQDPLDHAEAHMDVHAVVSDDGHAETALGPLDWQAWSYALVAAAAGVLVVVAFWFGAT
jgi:hypothetical protein